MSIVFASMSARALLVVLAAQVGLRSHAELASMTEIVVGSVRVQALSPTLLRVELKGPRGFEDRTTFTVVNRSFPGIPIWKESDDGVETVLSTDYYKIRMQADVGVYWQVTDIHGKQIYSAVDDLSMANIAAGPHRVPNLLHWPSPLQQKSYALVDFPRFFAPKWGPTPVPDGADIPPELRETSGFDFGNNVDGDTYVFLLGNKLEDWSASRLEFLQLTGPCPLLPDYAYGTWFTRWHNYTQKEAEDEVQQWDDLKLPLDVWGLDMNWRNTSTKRNNEMDASVDSSSGADWYYDRPDTSLFPSFTRWFQYLKQKRLRTYFNDHPYPVAARGAGGLQTSPEEVSFRYDGLKSWVEKGLNFWWYDRNWRFSIPPPFVNSSRTSASWEGLDNAAWGSYVFYKTVEVVQERTGEASRPLSLTKFAPFDWRPGVDPLGAHEHASHHRYPVWWTGDGVDLQASVETMVDGGIHHFKPFVHSDCGGDYRGSAGDMLRWTAHCAFGTIMRFHGSDHRPWSYDSHITSVVKRYIDARYKLMPSLIAAGQLTTLTGAPLAARGDFYWPELAPNSSTNQQYIFLKDLLVAPIWDSSTNLTKRTVWVPPGVWEDVWDGSVVYGPRHIETSQPFERQPMWYRRDGGLLVLSHQPSLRVDEQDWTSLTLEAFPSASKMVTERTLFERHTNKRTQISLSTNEDDKVFVNISRAEDQAARAWVLRIHLLPGQRARDIFVSDAIDSGGTSSSAAAYRYIYPASSVTSDIFPLEGPGSAPGQHAGPVLEVDLARSHHQRSVSIHMETTTSKFV